MQVCYGIMCEITGFENEGIPPLLRKWWALPLLDANARYKIPDNLAYKLKRRMVNAIDVYRRSTRKVHATYCGEIVLKRNTEAKRTQGRVQGSVVVTNFDRGSAAG